MGALTILVIRHAEKPDEAWPGPGLTASGAADSLSLVIRGWQRGGAWAALLGTGLGGADYPLPKAIYAAKPGADDQLDRGPSRRPHETILALAARLGLKPNTTFAKGEEAALVAELLTLSGVVLVSWEHKAIVENLLPRLPVGHGKPPAAWPDDRFDVVLRFDRPDGQAKFAFRPLYPQLLSGDSSTPLDGAAA
jgi:hypothetical protein